MKFSHSSYCLYHERLDQSPRDSVIYAYQWGLTHERLLGLTEQLGDWEYIHSLREKARKQLEEDGFIPKTDDLSTDVYTL